MRKLIEFLRGKKTYIVMGATFIVGGLQACGVEIPQWVYALLAAAGAGALRAGMGRLGTSCGDRRSP
jgi:hypothetical protein